MKISTANVVFSLLCLLGPVATSILRLGIVVVYYELSAEKTTYNRIEALVERGDKMEALKRIEDPNQLVNWMLHNAEAVREHQTFPDKMAMMTSQQFEERTAGKTKTLVMSVGLSRSIQRDFRRELKLRAREKKGIGLLGLFGGVSFVQLGLITFAMWFQKDWSEHSLAILYGREEAKLRAKLEPSKAEMIFTEGVLASQMYARDLYEAILLDSRRFNAAHAGQIKQVSGRNRASKKAAKESVAASRSSVTRLQYASDQGRFVAAATTSGNQPPTKPPRGPPSPTPSSLLSSQDDDKDEEIEVIIDDDDDDDDDVQILPAASAAKRKRPSTSVVLAPPNKRRRGPNVQQQQQQQQQQQPVVEVLNSSTEEEEWEKWRLTREEYERALETMASPPQEFFIDPELRVTVFEAPARVQSCGLLPNSQNAADVRPAYSANCSALDGYTVSSMAVLPPSVLSAHEERVGYHLTAPRLPTMPTVRPRAGTESLWRGLSWYTPTVTNGCNIDSFLTHVLLRARRQPDFARRYFLIPRNVAEGVLTLAIRDYLRDASWSSDAEAMQMMDRIKTNWSVANFWKFRDDLERDGRLDVVGGESNNIGRPLRDSSLLLRTTVCECLDTDGLNQLHTESLSEHADITWTPDMLRQFSATGQWNSPGANRKCSVCNNARFWSGTYVPDTTWFLPFDFETAPTHLNQFSLSQLPETLAFDELSRSDGARATFELGYVSLRNRRVTPNMVLHQTALMRFDNQWWYYNDMERDGRLLLVDDPDALIKKFGLSITAANYFRK